jgi:hypothetical protein
VEGEKAPGNKQQKHRFVVSTDVLCKRLQCIYAAYNVLYVSVRSQVRWFLTLGPAR